MTGPLLTADSLTRRFGSRVALDGLSLGVDAGELFGLVGPDGAGKTTALRLLAGQLRPDHGAARVLGMDPARAGERVRAALGYVPQQFSLYGDLSVQENIEFFGAMFGLRRRDIEERAEELLRLTRLSHFRARCADALSGGMYKKLAIACSLLHRPRVLLLDEPTNGVDPVSRRELWQLLQRFASEGMAVLLTTAYMDEAARCHRVGLLHQGRLIRSQTPGEMRQDDKLACFWLEARTRQDAEAALAHPAVLTAVVQGRRHRILVRKESEGELSRRVREIGGRLTETTPGFEDLFLFHTREDGRGA
jgi:ABC-2 type transport system ATP-binding protein